MTIALIKVSPPTILKVVQDGSMNVNVPGLWQSDGAMIGWASPDGAYTIVAITPFQVPQGQSATGSPRYTIDAQGNVSEVYDTVKLPPSAPAPINATSLGFYNLFTLSEQVAITTLAETDPQTALFVDKSNAAGTINLTDPLVTQGLAYLVAKGVLTQARANTIATGVPPS